MLDSEEYRELWKGKRYYTCTERTMSENDSFEENITENSSANVKKEVSEIQTLTQKVVNEQIRGYIVRLTRQLGELTRLVLVQGMTTTRHPNHYLRTEFGITSGTATYQSDTG